MHVDIRLLGGFEVVVDGERVPEDRWRRRHASAVVKLLALQPGRRMLREQLMDHLWPDLPVAEATPRLHKATHFARTALGVPEAVVVSGETLALLPSVEVSVDVDRFDQAADAAGRAAAGTGDTDADPMRLANAAVDRYRGDLLPEDVYESWTEEGRERRRLRYLELLRQAGRWEELVAADPSDEEAHVRLVHRLAQQGDRRAALRQYDLMERTLREELGSTPSDTARSLREVILALPAEDVAEEVAGAGRATPLPALTSRLVGRELDTENALASLEESRIVTFLGPGGVGKTTLAIETARRWCQEASVEACFVDLTKVDRGELVADLVAQELGIHRAAGSDADNVLREAVRGRPMLLLLDNFEHVIDAADIVTRLASWSAELRVVSTSRARLRVSGEQVFEVSPLPVDDEPCGDESATGDATALFGQVARTLDPGFELARHREDVAAICRTLDGLPLAIKLAAGHVRTLPPPLLRARLDTRLASPDGADRDSPRRQQTVPATIDWSLQLLGEPERRLFVRLGVFAGPVDLDAVEAVCATPGVDVIDSLARLVDQSLVRRLPGPKGEPRFGMLELLREHARRLLADADEEVMRRRHAEHYASLVESVEEHRWTDAADKWIDQVSGALPEVRAAHTWAQSRGEWVMAARMTASLGTYWHRDGHHVEGQRWVDQAMAHLEEYDEPLVGRLLLSAAFTTWPYADPVRTRTKWQAAADTFRDLGDKRYLAYALGLLPGSYIGDEENYDLAIRLCEESLALAREVGDRPLIAQTLNVLGELARTHGDDDLALAAYTEGMDLVMEVHDDAHLSVFLANLAYLADHRGDYEEARRLGLEALRKCWSLGRRMMAAWTVSELAGPCLGLGHPERGAVLVGAADQALAMLGVSRHPGDRAEHERVVRDLKDRLGADEFARLSAEGAQMSLREAVTLALSDTEELSRPPAATGMPR